MYVYACVLVCVLSDDGYLMCVCMCMCVCVRMCMYVHACMCMYVLSRVCATVTGCYSMVQFAAVCCSELQFVAVSTWRVLQFLAVSIWHVFPCDQYVAVCSSVCCSVLQCLAVSCSVFLVCPFVRPLYITHSSPDNTQGQNITGLMCTCGYMHAGVEHRGNGTHAKTHAYTCIHIYKHTCRCQSSR